MLTASIKGGIFTYCYHFGKNLVTIRGPKDSINLAVPYLTGKIKKAAH
jgi:hypothetical protein